MVIAKNIQDELATRDEIILALEMLTVDQASRLLALEGILDQIIKDSKFDTNEVHRVIAERSGRFKKHLEGGGLKGFVERAQGVASDILEAKKPRSKTNRSPNKRKKNS